MCESCVPGEKEKEIRSLNMAHLSPLNNLKLIFIHHQSVNYLLLQ